MRRRQSSLDLLFPDRLPSPRQSLHTRAVLGVALLIAIPTALCGYLTSGHAVAAMEESLMRDSALLSETTSHLVTGYIEKDLSKGLARALDHMMQDNRIAFVVISDQQGRVLAQRYNEPLAWNEYEKKVSPADRRSPVTLNRSLRLQKDDGSTLLVRRQLIYKPLDELQDDGAHDDSHPHARPIAGIFGVLELGLHDPLQVKMLGELREATLMVVAALWLLCVPLVIWWAHRWVKPLRRMLAASLRLGLGAAFQPIEVKREDEIGLLARSFNAMAFNLSAIQDALVQANEQLEQKVAQRTRQLQMLNTQLENEMAEKDQFLRAVSHDLGAPLRNIAGLASLLMLKHRADMNDDVLNKLERISANAKAETELLNDLLELSRIKQRQGRKHEIDVREMITNLGESLSFDLDHHRIKLVIDTTLPHVVAEKNRLRQVFQNLIENAIKYMPDEAKVREIHVGFARTNTGSAATRAFYVRDTGHGIAREDHKEIFQVFRRARHSVKSDVPGRGVGLATVKAIVECYGGRIWVESEPPNGATFWFTMDPSAVGDGVDPADRATDKPAANATAAATA
jgi:signal transduction histidine kinase